MNKEDLVLNNLQWLIIQKAQPNQTKAKISPHFFSVLPRRLE